MVFIRRTDAESMLLIANVDGSGERHLGSWKGSGGFRAADWSPDGKTIAYMVQSLTGGIRYRLAIKPAAGGPERNIASWRRLPQSAGLRWLPDGHGLLVTAEGGQVWYVAYPGGQLRQITNDLSTYSSPSLAADLSELVAVQTETDFRIWVVSSDGAAAPRAFTRSVP